jgi:hypothetical protein
MSYDCEDCSRTTTGEYEDDSPAIVVTKGNVVNSNSCSRNNNNSNNNNGYGNSCRAAGNSHSRSLFSISRRLNLIVPLGTRCRYALLKMQCIRGQMMTSDEKLAAENASGGGGGVGCRGRGDGCSDVGNCKLRRPPMSERMLSCPDTTTTQLSPCRLTMNNVELDANIDDDDVFEYADSASPVNGDKDERYNRLTSKSNDQEACDAAVVETAEFPDLIGAAVTPSVHGEKSNKLLDRCSPSSYDCHLLASSGDMCVNHACRRSSSMTVLPSFGSLSAPEDCDEKRPLSTLNERSGELLKLNRTGNGIVNYCSLVTSTAKATVVVVAETNGDDCQDSSTAAVRGRQSRGKNSLLEPPITNVGGISRCSFVVDESPNSSASRPIVHLRSPTLRRRWHTQNAAAKANDRKWPTATKACRRSTRRERKVTKTLAIVLG